MFCVAKRPMDWGAALCRHSHKAATPGPRPGCGLPAADRAGPPRAWGASGTPWQGLRQAGSGGVRADPRRGHQRAQDGRGWPDAGGWDGVKSSFVFPILMRDGTIVACESISIFDMGAHLGAGVQSGVSHTLGPYNIPN